MKLATGVTVISNGQVVDGTGKPAMQDSVVVIKDGKISYVGPAAGQPAVPPD